MNMPLPTRRFTVDEYCQYHPGTGGYDAGLSDLALTGSFAVPTPAGAVRCRPIFDHVVELRRQYPSDRVEAACGVPADHVVAAARTLWDARPVAYYAWSGIEMQTGATQIARAIAQLYTLTGSLDSPGGYVLFSAVPAASVAGEELLTPGRRSRMLGLADRPPGVRHLRRHPSRDPGAPSYPVRGMVGFGANLVMAHADSRRGPHLHQAHPVPRDAAPGAPQPAPAGAGSGAGAVPGRSRQAWRCRRRSGPPRDAAGQRPGAGPAQRLPRPSGGVRSARVVAALPGDRRARVRPLRTGRREL